MNVILIKNHTFENIYSNNKTILFLRVLFTNIITLDYILNPRGYQPPSSQCFDTNMVYEIYLLLKFTIPRLTMKIKVLLPRAYVTLFVTFGLLAPKDL